MRIICLEEQNVSKLIKLRLLRNKWRTMEFVVRIVCIVMRKLYVRLVKKISFFSMESAGHSAQREHMQIW